MEFKLSSQFKPTGDQPQAIESLVAGLELGAKEQVLLGVTGSGKTFTMANVIEKIQKPTLIISHNKTLAAQLTQEFKEFFPQNAVEYFVSYYDYYQPEAYIPQTDTYIDKESEINDLIEKLRLSTTASLLTRKDVIVVASVSCIYNIGSPIEYSKQILHLQKGKTTPIKELMAQLSHLHYERNDFDFSRSRFRLRGNALDLYPAWQDLPIRIVFDPLDKIIEIYQFDPLTGKKQFNFENYPIFSARHYMAALEDQESILQKIQSDMEEESALFKKRGQPLEAERIRQRVSYDLEMIREIGYCSGIENYSRYFDGRKPGDPPYSLLDYFKLFDQGQDSQSLTNWLMFIDESHITVPQIRGMYEGDRSRKNTLIDFGFRLKAAIDNRPLNFKEFQARQPQTIYVSATPDAWEEDRAHKTEQAISHLLLKNKKRSPKGWSAIAQQLIRPTGLLDPEISIKKTEGQISDLMTEIEKRITLGQRILVTTMTKRMAEDLSTFLKERNIRSMYLHSDIETLERTDILNDLRSGKYDVLVGINLLREGLDLPEVSLVAILDADKESFLRSRTSLLQVMGRAARHEQGSVIMYADSMTKSMKQAISEVKRRRKIQEAYNTKHHITPKSIEKKIRPQLIQVSEEEKDSLLHHQKKPDRSAPITTNLDLIKIEDEWPQYLPDQKKKIILQLRKAMKESAQDLNFETAATLRDLIKKLQ